MSSKQNLQILFTSFLVKLFININVIPGYDCPAFEGFYKCVTMVAGGTLNAVECLNNKSHSIAINWCGGWHHAHRCSIDLP